MVPLIFFVAVRKYMDSGFLAAANDGEQHRIPPNGARWRDYESVTARAITSSEEICGKLRPNLTLIPPRTRAQHTWIFPGRKSAKKWRASL
jgi:hypothetical protein